MGKKPISQKSPNILDSQQVSTDNETQNSIETDKASFREVINELSHINRQMASARNTLTEHLKHHCKYLAPGNGPWKWLKERIGTIVIQWEEENIAEKIAEAETIEIDEKERKKVVKRRKPLREKMRKFNPLTLVNRIERERVATAELEHMDKNDPIFNIAERILLNLATDTLSEDIISIQEAKESKIIPIETTPFSYPAISANKNIPYFISNYSIINLYRTLEDTRLRSTLPERGNFLETEEMIIASQLEKHIKIYFNKNTKHVEIEENCLEIAKLYMIELAKKRFLKKQRRENSAKIIDIAHWFKHK